MINVAMVNPMGARVITIKERDSAAIMTRAGDQFGTALWANNWTREKPRRRGLGKPRLLLK